jgi:hypothetical protein
MKILLCSEGVTDHGRDEYRDGEYRHEDGVLQILMRKLAGELDLSFTVRGRADIRNVQLLPRKFERPDILKARKLAALARREECKHIAYHRDEDNNGFGAMYRRVHGYFTVAAEKGMRCIAIIPMHMTEGWLLADAGAFPRRPNNPSLPNRPEEVWGNKDSDTHPKKYLERILQQFHKTASVAIFAEIAVNIDVEVARIRCPVSFGRFYQDMQMFIQQEEEV